MKSDNEPALTTCVKSWSNSGAMACRARTSVETRPVASPNSKKESWKERLNQFRARPVEDVSSLARVKWDRVKMKRATSDDLCAAMLPLEAEKTVNVEYERSSVGVGGRLRAQIGSRLVRKRQSGANNIAPLCGGRESGRGDDFTFARTGVELKKIRTMLCEWYGVKVPGMLGSAPNAQMEGWRIGVQSGRDTPTNVFEKCDLGVNIVSSAAVKTKRH